MTTPAQPDRPGNRTLAGATAALAVALAAVLASGVLHQTPAPLVACATGQLTLAMRAADTSSIRVTGDTITISPADSGVVSVNPDSQSFNVIARQGTSFPLAVVCENVSKSYRLRVQRPVQLAVPQSLTLNSAR